MWLVRRILTKRGQARERCRDTFGGRDTHTFYERVARERQGFELRTPPGEHVNVMPVCQTVEGEREVRQITDGGALHRLSIGRHGGWRYARYVV